VSEGTPFGPSSVTGPSSSTRTDCAASSVLINSSKVTRSPSCARKSSPCVRPKCAISARVASASLSQQSEAEAAGLHATSPFRYDGNPTRRSEVGTSRAGVHLHASAPPGALATRIALASGSASFGSFLAWYRSARDCCPKRKGVAEAPPNACSSLTLRCYVARRSSQAPTTLSPLTFSRCCLRFISSSVRSLLSTSKAKLVDGIQTSSSLDSAM